MTIIIGCNKSIDKIILTFFYFYSYNCYSHYDYFSIMFNSDHNYRMDP